MLNRASQGLPLVLGLWLFTAGSDLNAQSRAADAAEIRELIQQQARAFNSRDLEATLATFAPEVDWMAVGGRLYPNADSLADAMARWMASAEKRGNRLVYPPDSIRVTVFPDGFGTADVYLEWRTPNLGPVPHAVAATERLFLVLQRVEVGWRIRHVRNTTPN